MHTYTLVRPEHLNHFGYLFGGQLLRWVDEFAWLAASREFPRCRFVTRGMAEVEFRQQVVNGAILEFDVRREHVGTTSVRYAVEVRAQSPGVPEPTSVFFTRVAFVNVDTDGRKAPVKGRRPPTA
ncbi:MAG: Thioesterase superfamily protein [Lentisphaerae bacterium ADurb.BinA184]|nr:MAG: Thioesterase superfamily protein [Lentisphaerae bacterium ADurb.BinA184]